jgi:hypothetical protein
MKILLRKTAKKWACRLLVAPLLVLLGACSTPDVTHYAANQPVFDPVQFFVGKTDAWGMFQQRSGEVVKRFQVEITGRQQDGKLILEEHFRYDDGTTQERIWTLQQQADGSWRGHAGDVLGEASGHAAGNALNWRYTLLLPVDGKTYEMQMDDWMFLIDAQTMINRTSMRKFGVEVGQVSLFFRKRV